MTLSVKFWAIQNPSYSPCVTKTCCIPKIENPAGCNNGKRRLEMLKDMGVDYVQGYGLHRPCRFQDMLTGIR